MKSDVKTSIVQAYVQMEGNAFNELTSEVKETVATDVDLHKLNNGGSFGIIDLWNIRKGRRSARTQFRGVTIPNGIKS
ncbi:MAG: hypothetical protein P4L51_13395 [Puia sp.]|nr:hypothetical protein [Puia sp.]